MTGKLLLYAIYFTGVGAGALFASSGDSAGLRFHGWLILIGSVIGVLNHVGYKSAANKPDYDEALVRLGVIAALAWGVIGLLLESLIAAQAAYPQWQFDHAALSLGRLQNMHSAVMIYAFAGNILMATSFYVLKRTSEQHLSPKGVAYFVFWGYQLFLLLAVSGHWFGIDQGKIYASAEWYADIWLFIVLCAYILLYVETLRNRTQASVYVANWFFLAFIIAFAVLHSVNALALPVSLSSAHSYSLFSGIHEAMIQYWYRHNIIGFFLNIGFFGVVYYFLPKLTERPIYSYRLAIFHFWCVLFLYGWAAPHSLFHTALPDWVQNLAVAFGVMLLMPALGGVINGFMTARHRSAHLRRNPVVLMMLWGLLFYAINIAIGGLSAIKFLHIVDYSHHWGIFGIHFGGLGWAGLLGFAALYFLVPRLWRVRSLYSLKLVRWHIFLTVLSMFIHLGSLVVIGTLRFLREGAYDDFGFLRFALVDIGAEVHKFHIGYMAAAWLYLAGILLMVYNMYRTALLPKAEGRHA